MISIELWGQNKPISCTWKVAQLEADLAVLVFSTSQTRTDKSDSCK